MRLSSAVTPTCVGSNKNVDLKTTGDNKIRASYKNYNIKNSLSKTRPVIRICSVHISLFQALSLGGHYVIVNWKCVKPRRGKEFSALIEKPEHGMYLFYIIKYTYLHIVEETIFSFA